jgi:superfamily I DNA/RNA helicase
LSWAIHVLGLAPVTGLDDRPDSLEGYGSPTATGDGVRVVSMHAMKGLEFRCVAVIGVDEALVPLDSRVTPLEIDRAAHEDDLQIESQTGEPTAMAAAATEVELPGLQRGDEVACGRALASRTGEE